MKVKKVRWLALVLTLVMVFGLMGGVAGANGNGYIEWTGQGMDSMNCEEYEPGTMHWILNQAGNVEDPWLYLKDLYGNPLWDGGPSKMTGPTKRAMNSTIGSSVPGISALVAFSNNAMSSAHSGGAAKSFCKL